MANTFEISEWWETTDEGAPVAVVKKAVKEFEKRLSEILNPGDTLADTRFYKLVQDIEKRR